MNPTYEIEKAESLPLLQAIRSKLTEAGYKCRKFTGNDDGFYARNGKDWARVWLRFPDDKAAITWRFYPDPTAALHKLGVDYMIESTIVNFGVTSC